MVLLVGLLANGGAIAQGGDAPRFVGAKHCAVCHAAEAEAWQGSHHAQAMRMPTPDAVKGDFADAMFRQGDELTTFRQHEGAYVIRTPDADGTVRDHPVAYTFGVEPLQQYLLPWKGGRLQAFGLAWDTRPKPQGGQRWYSLYPDRTLAPGDPLHWTGRDQTWNYQCADCHSTNLRKNFDVASDSYRTTYSDVNVACESCHGPGSRHLAWANRRTAGQVGDDDPAKGLVTALSASDRGQWTMTPATGIARREDGPPSAAVIDACGGCHARRSVIAADGTAATPFLDRFRPALLEPDLYFADGQIDGEVFEYGSFLQSRMYRAGVVCTNCHEPHTARLRAPDNTLCLQCHQAERFDVAAHHHHAPESTGAKCVACHMPTRTYMGVDVRHDHGFRVPRPDLTAQIGVPNTCNACHDRENAAWAAQAIASWFPDGRQTQTHFALALQAGRTGQADAERRLSVLIRDHTQPGIARATALGLYGAYAGTGAIGVLMAAANDADPLVRMAAPRALPPAAPPAMRRILFPLLKDPIRAVRIQAASALAGLDGPDVSPAVRGDLDAAIRDLVAAEDVNADRPESHMNLGLLALRMQDPARAEAAYRTALRLDPSFTPALINLADVERARGQDAQAMANLRKALHLQPDSPAANHAMGLALIRQHDLPGALQALRRSSELAPDNARYAYVLAVALSETGARAQAVSLLQEVRRRHPADRDVLMALIAWSRQAGANEQAMAYARDLLALDPGNADYRRLVRTLAQPAK